MSYTLEQQKANRRIWAEALRSGKYSQIRGQLRTDLLGRCCLGVACDVLIVPWTKEGGTWLPSNHDMDDYMPSPLAEQFGMDTESLKKFVRWNDNARKTFAEIADIIESEPDGLFVESEKP